MKIAGVIAEYNPFHTGHAYHLQKTREQTGCDYVVVCMDGSYTQRGTAACLSKWERARMALRCGADAVFELPALFAVPYPLRQSARSALESPQWGLFCFWGTL